MIIINHMKVYTNLKKDISEMKQVLTYMCQGFIDDDNNETNIIREILNNYLYAIYEESLVVEVNDKVINKENIVHLLKEYKDVLESQTQELYNLLTLNTVNTYNKTILENEDIEIRVILDPLGSNTISMIRHPWMKVYNAVGFKRHFTFYGVCLVKGKRLNALLRKAENPQHDKWEAERVQEEDRILVRRALSDIRLAISVILEDLHEVPLEDSLDIFGAGEYIPLDGEGDQKAQEKVAENIIEADIKDVPHQLDESIVNEYEEEGSFVIDVDGNVDVEVLHPPVNDSSKR